MPSQVHVAGNTFSVLIAAIDLTHAPNRLEVVLGSCIGLAIYDAELRLAGMAHVLLPDSRGSAGRFPPGKYADRAAPALVDALIAHGARRSQLRAKIAGGARMFGAAASANDVGGANIAAVQAALARLAIPVASADTGGNRGRKAVFDPATAAYSVMTLDSCHDL